jgi:hypothetical protein
MARKNEKSIYKHEPENTSTMKYSYSKVFPATVGKYNFK